MSLTWNSHKNHVEGVDDVLLFEEVKDDATLRKSTANELESLDVMLTINDNVDQIDSCDHHDGDDFFDMEIAKQNQTHSGPISTTTRGNDGNSSNSNLIIVRGFSLYDSDTESEGGGSAVGDGGSVVGGVHVYCTPSCLEDDEDDEDDDEFSDYGEEDDIQAGPILNSAVIREQLKSFVPSIITALPEAKHLPSMDFNGFFLLADISGFTKLSSTLCALGSTGLDQLRGITNSSFSSFIDIILSHGGDVIAFAGDALICVFRPTLPCDGGGNSVNIAHCGLAAISCAKEICQTKQTGVEIHCAVTYGPMCAAILGGFNKIYSVLVNGPCTEEISHVLDAAGPNEVMVSAGVYRIVGQYLNTRESRKCVGGSAIGDSSKFSKKGEPLSSKESKVVDIITIKRGGPPVKVYKILAKPCFDPERTSVSQKNAISSANMGSPSHPLANDSVASLCSFLTKPVVAAAVSNDIEELAEIRTVTTLFLNLNSYSGEKFADLKKMQPFFLAMQNCLHTTGGLLRQFLIDDKGCVLIALWGVPTASYPSNSSRAISCAVYMREAAKAIKHSVSIGITTGSVYCGTVGSHLRREYVAIGRTVNLAARLMGKADGRVLVDGATFQKLSANVTKNMQEIEPLALKGIPKPVTCFEYYGTDAPASEHDKLDSGTIVIEKYLKRCITDIFDSHKFLNGSMIGLQVEQKEPTNVPSPEKSKKRQALKMLQSGSSGSSSDGDIGNDMTTSEKQRKSKVHKNIKKARKGMQQVIISSRINAFAISAHKKRQSTEATSSLTTKRTYKVKAEAVARFCAAPSARKVSIPHRCLPLPSFSQVLSLGAEKNSNAVINGGVSSRRGSKNSSDVGGSSSSSSEWAHNSKAEINKGEAGVQLKDASASASAAPQAHPAATESLRPSLEPLTSQTSSATFGSKQNIMDFNPDWSGFLVLKGGSGSGKTTVATHIIRQYEEVRRLQTEAITSFESSAVGKSGSKVTSSADVELKKEVMEDVAGKDTDRGKDGILARRIGHTHVIPEHLYQKIQASRDVHDWVPFVALVKADNAGLSAVRKIFMSMLLHTGCLATMDEEKEEILNLLTKTYPTHTKLEIVTLIFPFIQHLLDLEWCAEIKNGDIVVKPMLDAEDKDSNAKMRLHANKTSTFIRKSKDGTFIENNLETNETIVLSDLLKTLLTRNVAILVIDDAHHMSNESWGILMTLAKEPMDALVILTLLIKDTLRTDKAYKANRKGLKNSSETKQERTMLEMAHTAGRSMTRNLLVIESELEHFQDEYDELKDACLFTSINTRNKSQPAQASAQTVISSSSRTVTPSHSHSTVSFCINPSSNPVNCLYELKLEPLSPKGVVGLIKAALSLEQDNISDQTLSIVMDFTHGNPFLIWKIIRFFNDSDYTNFDQATGHLCDNSLIVSLIEGFSNVQKNVLKYCATIGEEFSFEVLLSVFPKSEKKLSHSQLHDVVIDLMKSGLIVRISENCYSFKSSLIRKFIYALIPPSVAALMHSDIASHLQRRYSHDKNAFSSLSYHYTNSGNNGTNVQHAYTFSLKTAEKYLEEMRLLEIMPFLQTCSDYVKSRQERNEVLSVVESCQKHITRVINAKKSTTLVSTATVNMDIDILNDVNSQLTKLHARLHTRFKSPYEKFLTCLLCCSMGGCFDLQKIRRMRQSRRRMKKSRIYHMGSKE